MIINNSNQLKHSYKSESKYFPLWDKLKDDLVVIITITNKTTTMKRLKKAIAEIKYNDDAYARYCELYYGTKLKLEYTALNDFELQVRLHGTNQKNKPQIESTYL